MLEYVVKGRYAEIVGATFDETIINIPKKIDDYIVVKIAENAFLEHPSLISITIPKTVRVIGSYAFASCKKLKKVTIEEGLQYINDWAFISCNIEDITLPKSLIYLGENAFLGAKCYEKIRIWKEEHKTLTPIYNKSKYDLCIIPTKALSNVDDINRNFVEQLKAYQDLQLSEYNEKNENLYSLDLPYVFDNHEFVVAINSKQKLEDLSIYIPSKTYMHVGNYADDDPDFILFELEVYSTNVLLGSVFFKMPYPDEVSLKIIEESYINGVNVLRIIPSISSFGSGNIDREFAVNHYDEIIAKFNTAYKNKIISFETYNEIEQKIYLMGKSKVWQFITSIENAPLLNLVLKAFDLILNDKSYSDKSTEIDEYIDNLINSLYTNLSDINSVYKLAFNVSNHFKFLKYITGLDKEEIINKYNLKLLDKNQLPVSNDRLQEISDSFYEDEELYNLHGYIYEEIMFELANFIEEYYDSKLIDYLKYFSV